MAEVLQCHVFARPDFAMGGPHGGAPHVDRMATAGLTEPAAPRNAVSPWEAGPWERRFTVGGSGKSVARCHRTVLAYWKFESISLRYLRRILSNCNNILDNPIPVIPTIPPVAIL